LNAGDQQTPSYVELALNSDYNQYQSLDSGSFNAASSSAQHPYQSTELQNNDDSAGYQSTLFVHLFSF